MNTRSKRYEEEKEWRFVIPKRDAHEKFFNVPDSKKPNLKKRDLSKVMISITLGPNIEELENHKNYIEYALKVGKELKIPIYKADLKKDALVRNTLWEP